MASEPRDPVVIIGAGFGGLYTALALSERRQHPPILLIEPNDHFLFLPLLYELLSQELRGWEVAPSYDTLLAGRGIAWLQERVDGIDSDRRTITTSSGRRLSYCKAVVATGSTTQSFGIPGVHEHCLSFRSLADVQRLQQLIATLRRRQRPLQRLAVVGGGASGVELACKLADELVGAAVIELLERGPTLLPQARSFNREQALLALQRRDVRVRTGTAVVAVAADHLQLGPDSERLACDGVIWTAGIRCQPPAISPAPQTDASGRLHTRNDLQLCDRADLFAIGDAAHCDDGAGRPLPATAQVAFQQADCLADNLMRALAGEPLRPFSFQDLGEMLSLGRQEATLTGAGITLAGRAAHELRRLAYLTRMPGAGHRFRVAAGWLAAWS